ncbi:MAG: ATP-dependent helicase [Oscillospiraceae bacterium]|jgi:DNA helicase-2/ATP-dependent DNA helicase PcrA
MTEFEFEKRYVAARRKVIEADFAHLNPQQRQAVLTTEGPLLLLAGAGSGKTTVLINRIANLLRYGRGSDSFELPVGAGQRELEILEAGYSPEARRLAALEPVESWRIIAITFTNKAADELKDRLAKIIGPEAEDVWAMTFHSACVRILRRDVERLGFQKGFTIYDTSDSLSVIKRVLKELNLDEKSFPPQSILSQMGKAKDMLISPEDFLAKARASGDIRRIRIGEVYSAYARRLRESNAMDFDDLIYYAVRLLMEHEDIRDYYQRRFQYVLIDEYQDTNNLQYLLASILAGGYENICVVGDDDQSIYRFRGATIENILNFEKQYENAKVIRLEQNYRSTGHILETANAVISNNKGRKGKRLWTDKGEGEKLTLYMARNESDEAQFVAARIMENYARGHSWRDHAVLYRMNAQSNQIEYAFKRQGIPYRIVGGTRFFDRAEVKDMLAYLWVILTPSDDLRLTRIINNPPRGIGSRTVELIQELAAQQGIPMFEVIKRADEYAGLQRSAVRLRQFANMILELQEASEYLPLDELYDLVLERTGYMVMLTKKDNAENQARAENVRELKSNIISYMNDTGDATLAGFLDEVALYTDIDQYDREADCVVMMTMHSAKGLEFPTVFIVGAEEGIFPGIRSIGEPEEMEEERRLYYVAITRAQEKLYISSARQRMLFGRTTSNRPSRFLEEIPEEHIERIMPEPRDYEFMAGIAPEARNYGFRPGVDTPRSSKTHALRSIAGEPERREAPDFKTGDCVVHKAFGEGVIVKMTPMGGDALIEVEFENVGLKRLMLKAAAQHMTKKQT